MTPGDWIAAGVALILVLAIAVIFLDEKDDF